MALHQDPRGAATDACVPGEIVAGAVRRVAAAALERDVSCSFDDRGLAIAVRADGALLQRSVERLLRAAVAMVETGSVACDAESHRARPGKCVLSLKVAAIGTLVAEERLRAVLRQLDLVDEMRSGARLHRARGTCPLTGAAIDFSSHPSRGALFGAAWTFLVEAVEPLHARLDAGFAPAWIVHDDKVVADSLARRLERLGWTPSVFDTPAAALRRLRARAADGEPPAALLAIECSAVSPTSVQPLAALPDDATQGIYAALPGSPVLRLPELVSGLEVRPHPFSARDLDAMTARLALGRDDPRAAWPQPAPSRPTMLVVDDDPVARLTHGALGRMLGYEVRTAEGGLDALEQCRCWRPELVLMDLEMPGMDGFAATRRLRELEAEGRLPPARIVAVTGTAPGPLTPAAGLDAWLRKPIARDALQQTIDALDGWAADAQPGEGGACAGFGPSPSA